ncbi:MAG: ABC transporter ATP-binding protein [Candidatus Rokubacteria bacterium]|nr:ABC transporter ATP-binding protein [Candidatus Rokubacteria bacterium]
MAFVVVSDLSKTFISKNQMVIAALANVSLEMERNQFLCIVGPSGGGKSTLLNIMAGFERPSQGKVLVGGHEVKGPSPSRAMVFQEFALFPWFTVRENVAFGLEMQSMSKPERDEVVSHYLDLVGLRRFANNFPIELSGGMKQRVAIARALAVNPEMLLMDEPFGGLDSHTRGFMQQELLRIWEKERKTVAFVTHSIDEAITLADTVAVIAGRPGTVRSFTKVSLPRPREEADPEFVKLKVEVRSQIQAASLSEEEWETDAGGVGRESRWRKFRLFAR